MNGVTTLGKSQGQKPRGRRLQGFWARYFPRELHLPPYTEGFSNLFQPVPREYHTQFYVVEVQTLIELNQNILVRRFQRMN